VPAPGADPVVLAVGEQRIAVLAGRRDRALALYDGSGHRIGTVAGSRLAGTAATGWPPGVEVGDLLLLWTGRLVVAVDPAAATLRWAARAEGPPALDGGQVLFAVPGGFVECSPRTGRVLRRVATEGGTPHRGARPARIGRLLVAAGPDGTAAAALRRAPAGGRMEW
jgi:hypothetical protein